jgi:lipopolysaccharide/colanic/teichoic acid biosynthesis glycosyltransferase
MSFYRNNGKRLFDLALAIPGLILAAPLLAFIAGLVRIRIGSPVLFRQQRPGLHGRPFEILKFRTMTDARDAQGRLLADADRMTPFGRLLRRTSLDEIPALINVIRGEMSLVGPRPLLMEYLDRYTSQQARRHEVVPGITGWAQIHGRNDVRFSERLKLDVWYVEHLSLSLDVRIVCETLLKVVRASGVRLDQTLQEVDDIGLHPATGQNVFVSRLTAAGASSTEPKGGTRLS